MALLMAGSFAVLQACGDKAPTSLDRSLEGAAKPSSGDPTVTGTDPNNAPQGVTLDVRVLGSGFDRGSKAELALDCETGCVITEKVKTNSTQFVSQTELVANITIAADADTALYDVLVTTSKGKRGIGIELFTVKTGPTNPQTGYSQIIIGRLSGPTNCPALAISELDYVAGYCFHSKKGYEAFFWRPGSEIMSLGPGRAEDVSDGSVPVVVGHYYDPGADDLIGVVWEPLISASPTLLPSNCSSDPGVAGITGDGNLIAGFNCGSAVLWTREGTGWSAPQLLPLPMGFTAASAVDISKNGVVLGAVFPNGPTGTNFAVWFPPYNSAEVLPTGELTYLNAAAINDQGDVVGNSTGGSWKTLYWKWNGSGYDSPLVIDPEGWSANGINNLGTVVGSGLGVGWVWTATTGAISLAGQGVYDANDKGKLSGHDDPGRAVIWVPSQ